MYSYGILVNSTGVTCFWTHTSLHNNVLMYFYGTLMVKAKLKMYLFDQAFWLNHWFIHECQLLPVSYMCVSKCVCVCECACVLVCFWWPNLTSKPFHSQDKILAGENYADLAGPLVSPLPHIASSHDAQLEVSQSLQPVSLQPCPVQQRHLTHPCRANPQVRFMHIYIQDTTTMTTHTDLLQQHNTTTIHIGTKQTRRDWDTHTDSDTQWHTHTGRGTHTHTHTQIVYFERERDTDRESQGQCVT